MNNFEIQQKAWNEGSPTNRLLLSKHKLLIENYTARCMELLEKEVLKR